MDIKSRRWEGVQIAAYLSFTTYCKLTLAYSSCVSLSSDSHNPYEPFPFLVISQHIPSGVMGVHISSF